MWNKIRIIIFSRGHVEVRCLEMRNIYAHRLIDIARKFNYCYICFLYNIHVLDMINKIKISRLYCLR